MNINGTLVNYYFHCKRQCYLFGNRLNLEDNSERVKIGKALHEEKYQGDSNAELAIDNIRLDKLTSKYLIETKKSDADVEATKWQVLYYLSILKAKGISRIGKIEYIEKNKQDKKIVYVELTLEIEVRIQEISEEIRQLIERDTVPPVLHEPKCKKCAYYAYCYI